MAHRLVPQPDIKLLTPEQIVRRLRAEFDYVYADVSDADFYLAAMIDHCRKVNDQETLRRYEAMIGKSIRIVVSDREFYEDDHIRFVAKPEEMPFIGYRDGIHERAAAQLLERVCKALRYNAVLV